MQHSTKVNAEHSVRYWCLQVFPYFYVRCGPILPQGTAALRHFLLTFENSLNTVLERLTSAQRFADPAAGPGEAAPPVAHYVPQYSEAAPASEHASGEVAHAKAQHVFAVTLVKAGCFYGYNAAEEPFLRVCLCALALHAALHFGAQLHVVRSHLVFAAYSALCSRSYLSRVRLPDRACKHLLALCPPCRLRPAAVAKAADALVSGAVMGLKLQPFEAHIPYLLQFKIDMNLYGMSHLLCRAVFFRRDPPQDAPPAAPHGWRHRVTQTSQRYGSQSAQGPSSSVRQRAAVSSYACGKHRASAQQQS